MSFVLSFPGHKSAEPHTGLMDEEDVYEAVKQEVRQSISDMGSDGYEPIFNEGDPTWDDGDEKAAEQAVMEAIERGIDHAVMMHTPEIFKKLWVRYRVDGEGVEDDTAVDNTTYATLPDGTKVALKEED